MHCFGGNARDKGRLKCFSNSPCEDAEKSVTKSGDVETAASLSATFLDELPARLIGDRTYDSDPLDRRLKRAYRIELIAPSRENRSQTRTGVSCDAKSDVGCRAVI